MLEFKFQISDTYAPEKFINEVLENFTSECTLYIELELSRQKHADSHNTYVARFNEPLACFYLGKSVSHVIH